MGAPLAAVAGRWRQRHEALLQHLCRRRRVTLYLAPESFRAPSSPLHQVFKRQICRRRRSGTLLTSHGATNAAVVGDKLTAVMEDPRIEFCHEFRLRGKDLNASKSCIGSRSTKPHFRDVINEGACFLVTRPTNKS